MVEEVVFMLDADNESLLHLTDECHCQSLTRTQEQSSVVVALFEGRGRESLVLLSDLIMFD